MASKQDNLVSLRQSILEQVVPLLDGGNLDPEQRFTLTLRLAQAQGTYELYEKAYKLVGDMQQNEEKLSSYMELLDEIEYEIDADNQQNDSGADSSQTSDKNDKLVDNVVEDITDQTSPDEPGRDDNQ